RGGRRPHRPRRRVDPPRLGRGEPRRGAAACPAGPGGARAGPAEAEGTGAPDFDRHHEGGGRATCGPGRRRYAERHLRHDLRPRDAGGRGRAPPSGRPAAPPRPAGDDAARAALPAPASGGGGAPARGRGAGACRRRGRGSHRHRSGVRLRQEARTQPGAHPAPRPPAQPRPPDPRRHVAQVVPPIGRRRAAGGADRGDARVGGIGPRGRGCYHSGPRRACGRARGAHGRRRPPRLPRGSMIDWLFPGAGPLTFGWRDALDVLLMAVLVYQVGLLIRGTRALQTLLGVLVVIVAYWSTGPDKPLRLATFHQVLGHILFYAPFAVIVLFQSAIRRVLAGLGRTSILGIGSLGMTGPMVEEIVAAVLTLSARRTGALFVIEREQAL